MSSRNSSAAFKIERQAHVFAALGDPTRLSLVNKLIDRQPHSISHLTAGTKITRQAVTKHLAVLEEVGLVTKNREGREILYLLRPEPLESLQKYLEVISQQWDQALENLKAFAES